MESRQSLSRPSQRSSLDVRETDQAHLVHALAPVWLPQLLDTYSLMVASLQPCLSTVPRPATWTPTPGKLRHAPVSDWPEGGPPRTVGY